jgi:3'-phosphoadenosine 5'-phosphosulfate sulfotransferase (PAPS reductase)/FAD synthetase
VNLHSVKTERKNYVEIENKEKKSIERLLRKAKLDKDDTKVKFFAELLHSGKLIEDKLDKDKDAFYSLLILNHALREVGELSKEVDSLRMNLIDNDQYFNCEILSNDLVAEDVKVIEITSSDKLINYAEDYPEELDANMYDLSLNKICGFNQGIIEILDKLNVKYEVKNIESYETKAKKAIQKALGELVIWLKKYQRIVMFSGGKDSTAMLIRMIEEGQRIDKIVFADTMLEFPEMYKYIADIERYIKREITIIKGDNTFNDWFYGKWSRGKSEGMARGFPKVVGLGCWAKRELKIKPIKRVEGVGNEIFIGIAADEKERAYREEYQKDNIYRLPLIDWEMTEKDCIKFLEERNLSNPLYENFKRLGCWLCPKQGLGSLKSLYKHYPELWAELKKYEEDSPTGFKIDTNISELEERFKQELFMQDNQICML